MRIFGRIADVVVDGHERLLRIRQSGSFDGQILCVFAIEPESWRVPGQLSERFRIGDMIDARAEIRLVIEVATAGVDSVLGMRQPIPSSSHTQVIARVVETSTKDSFECSLSSGASVHVETEHPISVMAGEIVAFTGELALVDAGG